MSPNTLEDVGVHNFIDISTVPSLVADLRASFDQGRTRPIAWRRRQLEGIKRLLIEKEDAICEALAKDVGKPRFEAFTAEVSFTLGELNDLLGQLDKLARPEKVGTPIFAMPGKSEIYKDPLGVVLVIAPWNYPFQLAMGPLIGAVAAGNCVALKPSEVAAHTSNLLATELPNYVDTSCIQVIEGAVEETTALLAERFDHIFYTGNGAVGRIVMRAASEHLTPVTLELGGKSPCYVDEHLDLEVAARRIIWGKFFNAGQTCVAPDYILVHRRMHDRLVDKLGEVIKEFYGDDPQTSKDYARVVNARHHKRLVALLESGKTVVGGTHDERDRYIAPTLLTQVSVDSPVMADEIFGPILPILAVDGVEEAVRFINARPKPLAMYVFSTDKRNVEILLERTSSGGVTVNHAWLHLSNPNLPFGGVGESGMGAYHGRTSFDVFTHRKSVLKKSNMMDVDLVYPPYTESKEKWVRRLL